MKNLPVGRRPHVVVAAAVVVLAAAVAVLNLIGRPNFSTLAIVEHPVLTGAGGASRGFASCSRATDCDVMATLRNDGASTAGRAVFSVATYSIAREQQPDTHCEARIPQTARGASVQASCRLSASGGNYLEDPVTVQVEK